jgi:hypothetical protein
MVDFSERPISSSAELFGVDDGSRNTSGDTANSPAFPDMPRPDRELDLLWWTHKLFEQLIDSEYGEFDVDGAINRVEARYGIEQPSDDNAFWALQRRLMEVADYDNTDFMVTTLEGTIADLTRYDDLQEGEQ